MQSQEPTKKERQIRLLVWGERATHSCFVAPVDNVRYTSRLLRVLKESSPLTDVPDFLNRVHKPNPGVFEMALCIGKDNLQALAEKFGVTFTTEGQGLEVLVSQTREERNGTAVRVKEIKIPSDPNWLLHSQGMFKDQLKILPPGSAPEAFDSWNYNLHSLRHQVQLKLTSGDFYEYLDPNYCYLVNKERIVTVLDMKERRFCTPNPIPVTQFDIKKVEFSPIPSNETMMLAPVHQHPAMVLTVMRLIQIRDNKLQDVYLLNDTDVILNDEPCPMCAMALMHSRARRVLVRKVKHNGKGVRIFNTPGLNWSLDAFLIERPQGEGEEQCQ